MRYLMGVLRGLGVAAVILAAVRTGEARHPSQDVSTGTMTTLARQPNSPVFLSECTIAIGQEAPNYLLRRVVLRNAQNAAVTGYQLGYVVVYRDSHRPPKVFSQSNFTETALKSKDTVEAGQPLGQDDDTEYSLVPPVPAADDLRMVSFFVAKARSADGSEFHENLKNIAAHERELAFAPR